MGKPCYDLNTQCIRLSTTRTVQCQNIIVVALPFSYLYSWSVCLSVHLYVISMRTKLRVKIDLNLPGTYEKLHCKGEPYKIIRHKHTQTLFFFVIFIKIINLIHKILVVCNLTVLLFFGCEVPCFNL